MRAGWSVKPLLSHSRSTMFDHIFFSFHWFEGSNLKSAKKKFGLIFRTILVSNWYQSLAAEKGHEQYKEQPKVDVIESVKNVSDSV